MPHWLFRIIPIIPPWNNRNHSNPNLICWWWWPKQHMIDSRWTWKFNQDCIKILPWSIEINQWKHSIWNIALNLLVSFSVQLHEMRRTIQCNLNQKESLSARVRDVTVTVVRRDVTARWPLSLPGLTDSEVTSVRLHSSTVCQTFCFLPVETGILNHKFEGIHSLSGQLRLWLGLTYCYLKKTAPYKKTMQTKRKARRLESRRPTTSANQVPINGY